LSRKAVIYDVEYSFSGENIPLEILEKKLHEQRNKRAGSLVEYERAEDQSPVKGNTFTFYKMEQIGLGQAMLARSQECVISFGQFLANSNEHDSLVYRECRLVQSDLDAFRDFLRTFINEPTKSNKMQLFRFRRRLVWIHNSLQVINQNADRRSAYVKGTTKLAQPTITASVASTTRETGSWWEYITHVVLGVAVGALAGRFVSQR